MRKWTIVCIHELILTLRGLYQITVNIAIIIHYIHIHKSILYNRHLLANRTCQLTVKNMWEMHLWHFICTLQWRHNGHDSVSNHQPHGCLLNRLFRRRSKKTSKLRVTGLCTGNSPGTGEFPAQMASYAENVSIWWRHHDIDVCIARIWKWHSPCSTLIGLFVLHAWIDSFGLNKWPLTQTVLLKCVC